MAKLRDVWMGVGVRLRDKTAVVLTFSDKPTTAAMNALSRGKEEGCDFTGTFRCVDTVGFDVREWLGKRAGIVGDDASQFLLAIARMINDVSLRAGNGRPQ